MSGKGEPRPVELVHVIGWRCAAFTKINEASYDKVLEESKALLKQARMGHPAAVHRVVSVARWVFVNTIASVRARLNAVEMNNTTLADIKSATHLLEHARAPFDSVRLEWSSDHLDRAEAIVSRLETTNRKANP